MTPEQIENLKNAVVAIRDVCNETEAVISDYAKCESEIARKYLGAAIKKQAAAITAAVSQMPAEQAS